MDSKSLYRKTENLKSKIHWQSSHGEEWFNYGSVKACDLSFVQAKVSYFFQEDHIFLVFSPEHSGALDNRIFSRFFDRILATENFFLWNKNFSKVIEFNRFGILRYGDIKNGP